MITDKKKILSTRPLPQPLINDAASDNIDIDVISFIHTEALESNALASQLAELFTKKIVAVFTSMNAVEAITAFGFRDPEWKIFCIGDTTATLVRKHFGNVIAGSAINASELADVILDAELREVVFFCGDQRRPELPEKLKSNNVAVKEVVVYKTTATPESLKKEYDGILFFSPSAVESFFAVNSLNNETVLFAIGGTTADTIRKFSDNPVITSERPGKEALGLKAIAYFKSIRALH
ncbi:MAG TPA: uroporphyrinogen-III synthase [Chitinophagaceae bacterium]